MRVKFKEDVLFENEGRNKGQLFKAGEVYDFEDAFAQRWIRRDKAESVDPVPQFQPVSRPKYTPLTADEQRRPPTAETKGADSVSGAQSDKTDQSKAR